jgi:RNA polymerase sigma-70 factor, ECF subfamily
MATLSSSFTLRNFFSIRSHKGLEMSLNTNGPPAVESVYVEHIDGLYGYALVLTRSRSEADDLVQETYVRAIGAMGRLRVGSNLKGWLFTIMRNIWFNQSRQQRRARLVPLHENESAMHMAETTENPYAFYVSEMERKVVRQAIHQLPVDFREIILLRDFEDLSYQEIATMLNRPVGTVMSRLARARAKLRTLLSGTFVTSDFIRKETE